LKPSIHAQLNHAAQPISVALEQVRQGLSVACAETVDELAGIARVVCHGQSPYLFNMRAGAIAGQGRCHFDQPGAAVGLDRPLRPAPKSVAHSLIPGAGVSSAGAFEPKTIGAFVGHTFLRATSFSGRILSSDRERMEAFLSRENIHEEQTLAAAERRATLVFDIPGPARAGSEKHRVALADFPGPLQSSQ
jgi:hypothetical protein